MHFIIYDICSFKVHKGMAPTLCVSKYGENKWVPMRLLEKKQCFEKNTYFGSFEGVRFFLDLSISYLSSHVSCQFLSNSIHSHNR